CLLSDCTNTAQANGFCYAHGGYQVCYALGYCTNTAQANGFCYAHGGYQVCYALGCNRRA
ncbi:hypothetical protein PHYSODRAFT_433280, partial [Phytophthora sojae]